MKKTLLLFLSAILILAGCAKKAETPAETPKASPSPAQSAPAEDEKPLADMVNETAFAGRVTEITDTTISIIMDEKVTETFNLNDRAKRDITALDIKVDSRIVVNFDTVENREITGLEVEM